MNDTVVAWSVPENTPPETHSWRSRPVDNSRTLCHEFMRVKGGAGFFHCMLRRAHKPCPMAFPRWAENLIDGPFRVGAQRV